MAPSHRPGRLVERSIQATHEADNNMHVIRHIHFAVLNECNCISYSFICCSGGKSIKGTVRQTVKEPSTVRKKHF